MAVLLRQRQSSRWLYGFRAFASSAEAVKPLPFSISLSPHSATHTPSPSHSSALPSVVTLASDTSAFSKLGLCSELMGGLQLLGLSQPTEIQSLAVPEMLKRQNLILASQTGSGKTLAYAMPLIHMLRQDEQRLKNPINSRPYRPRALVILPTRELCYQVKKLFKQLAHHARVRVACLTGGPGMQVTKKRLKEPIDILIGTPATLKTHTTKRINRLVFADVEYVVVDEADTLYGRSRRVDKDAARRKHYDMGTTEFDEEMKDLLFPITERVEKGTKHPNVKPCQFVFVTASLPPSVTGRILDDFPDAKRILSKSLHKVPPLLRQVFVRVGNRDKLQLLDEVITARESKYMVAAAKTSPTLALAPLQPGMAASISDSSPLRGLDSVADRITKVPTIIFTNTVDACRAASLFLAARGYSVACYHGAMPPARRAESFNSFVSGERKIMVCTDLGSRGLDTSMVQHVIMMDFPRTMQDYLHRAGRTARAGTKGLVTCFIKSRDAPLARDLAQSVCLDMRVDRRVPLESGTLVRKSRRQELLKKKKRIWFETPGVPKRSAAKSSIEWQGLRGRTRRKGAPLTPPPIDRSGPIPPKPGYLHNKKRKKGAYTAGIKNKKKKSGLYRGAPGSASLSQFDFPYQPEYG